MKIILVIWKLHSGIKFSFRIFRDCSYFWNEEGTSARKGFCVMMTFNFKSSITVFPCQTLIFLCYAFLLVSEMGWHFFLIEGTPFMKFLKWEWAWHNQRSLMWLVQVQHEDWVTEWWWCVDGHGSFRASTELMTRVVKQHYEWKNTTVVILSCIKWGKPLDLIENATLIIFPANDLYSKGISEYS